MELRIPRELMRRAGLLWNTKASYAALAIVGAVFGWWMYQSWVGSPSTPPGVVEGASNSVEETAAPVSLLDHGVEASETPEPEPIFVHLVGAVLRPGVYILDEGDRLTDAVTLAGGLTGNADERSINLARMVCDGEQVLVLTEDEFASVGIGVPYDVVASGTGARTSTSEPQATPGLIDINKADSASLETLPGIGPATAANIISDRESNGPFQDVDDLVRVSGIGDKSMEAIRDLVCVG